MQNTTQIGKILKDRFKVLKKIGQGGWGVVFKGLDLTNANAVAIKQVPLAGIPKEELKSIMNEINLLQHLKHPKIVTYIDSSQTDNSLFIVLEFIENGSLADITKEIGRFPESLIVLYISQVLEGLHYLHSEGVIHRDIKAANILATKDGGVKVADFGVSTNIANDNASVMGSPYWMAPEIIELNGASPKSDIWSLGCTVIELLTGKPPYYDLDQMPALFRIVQDDCPPLPDGISSLCKDFLMQCFQKEPLLRKSAQELLKHRWISFHKKKRQQQNQSNAAQSGAPSGPSDVKEEVQAFAILRQRNVEAIKHSGRKRLESAPIVPNSRQPEASGYLQPPTNQKKNAEPKQNLAVRAAASPQHIHTSKKSRKSNKGDTSARKKKEGGGGGGELRTRVHPTKEPSQGTSHQVLEVIGNGEDEEWSDYSLKAPKAYNSPERTTPRRPVYLGHARIQSRDLAKWVENGSDDDEEWYEGTIHKNMVNTPLKAAAASKKKEKSSSKKKKSGKKKNLHPDKKKKTDKIRNPDPHLSKQHRRMSSNDLNKWVEYDSEETDDWYDSPDHKKVAEIEVNVQSKKPKDKPAFKKAISPRPKNGRNQVDKKTEKPEKSNPVQKNSLPGKTPTIENYEIEVEDDDDWESSKSEQSLPKISSGSIPGGDPESDDDFSEKFKKSEKQQKKEEPGKTGKIGNSSACDPEEISEEDWDKKQDEIQMEEVSDDGGWDTPRSPKGHNNNKVGVAGKDSEDFKKWSEEKSADSDWDNETPSPKIVIPGVTVSKVGGAPDLNFLDEEDSDSFDKTPRIKTQQLKTPLPNSPRSKTPRGKGALKTSQQAKSPRLKTPRPNTSGTPEMIPAEAAKDGEQNLSQYQEKSESDSWDEPKDSAKEKPTDENSPQPDHSNKPGVTTNGAGDKANVTLSDYFEEDSWSDIEEGMNDEDANAMVLLSKLNRLKAEPVAPVNQEDDPFSDIFSEEEDDFDELDIEENLKKEHLQEVNREITKLVVLILEKDQTEKVILESCNTLVEKLREYPGQKGVLIKSEGVIPIIEMLQVEVKNLDVLHAILQVVNEITEDDLQIQKSVRVMGSIPTIIAFWGPMPGQERSEHPNYYPTPIREQTIRFFRNMMERNEKVESSVLRNFIASRALPAVKYLLEPSNNYSSNKTIQRFGVDLMFKILRVKLTSKDTSSLPIKKNDFCRIWARSGLLPSLARALVNFNADRSLRGEYVPKISEIILFFSKSDEIVKQLFCAQEVLVPLVTVLDKLQRKPLLDILKAIKDIAQESRTLDAMQKAGAIPRLVSLMSMRETQYDLITDTHTQYILQALFSLCRIVAARQEEAAKEGIIPHLKHFIDTDSTSKQFALPIILEFARAKKTLPFLWENNCVEFYISLSDQHYPWQVQAVDALATWAAAEPDRVVPIIIQEKHVIPLHSLFKSTQGEAFSTLIEPFQKIVSHNAVARSLILVGFIRTILDRIVHPNALVRLNLLKVLMTLFSASTDPKDLIQQYNLFDLVKKLEKDHAVLVAEMAGQLKVQFLQHIK